MKSEGYKKGHFIGVGLAIGIPIGIPIALVVGMLALGPAIGAAIGLIIGGVMEQRLNKNPIELTREEKRKRVTWFGMLAIIGLLVFVSFLLIKNQ